MMPTSGADSISLEHLHDLDKQPGAIERDPLGKAVRVLRWMLDNPKRAWGTRELAGQLKMNPSTLHRTLASLARVSLVVQSEDERYLLGPEFQRMAWQAVAAYPLEEIVRPYLEELTDLTGESVVFAVYDHYRQEMMFIVTTAARLPLQYVIRRYEWMPVHAGASGLAILSALPQAEADDLIDNLDLVSLTSHTLTSKAELRESVAEFRRIGFAHTKRQRINDAVGISVPIWDSAGRVLGSATLTIPESRFDDSTAVALAKMVVDCGRQIEHGLGRRLP